MVPSPFLNYWIKINTQCKFKDISRQKHQEEEKHRKKTKRHSSTHLLEEILYDSLLGDIRANGETILELSFDLSHLLLIGVRREPLRPGERSRESCVQSGDLEEPQCLVNVALEGEGRE